MELDNRRLISMYQRMYTIRVFDQTAVDEFHAGTIPRRGPLLCRPGSRRRRCLLRPP